MTAADPVRPPRLWYKYDVTLASALSSQEARERMGGILPRFAVPSGEPIPRFGVSLSRYYLGSMTGEKFTLRGPYFLGGQKGSALGVEGVIAEDGGRALIRITASPASALAGAFLLGLVGLVLGGILFVLDRAVLLPLFLILLCGLLGVAWYTIGRLMAVSKLNELVQCLEAVLKARRRT